MTTQPAHRLQRSNWLPTLTAVAVLLVCLFYTFALAYLAPYPGITLNTGWVVTWIDPCNPSSTGCQANQNVVQVGDQVLRIGKLDYEKYRHDRRLVPFGSYSPGESVSIVLSRGGRSRTIGWQMPEVTAVERIKRMGSPILYLPFWLAGTVLILFLRPRDRRWQLLVAFNYVTAIWLAIGLVSAWNVAASSLVLHAVTWLLMPIYLHLHLLVPTPLLGKRFRYLVPSLYVIGTILAALELDQLLPRNLYALALLLAILGSLGILVWRLFAPSSLSARLSTRLILVGIGLAFGPAVVLALIPNLLGPSAPDGLAINVSLLAIPVLPFFYIYAVYKHRLGALEFRANRLLSAYSFALLYITVVALVALLGWRLMLNHDEFTVLFLAVSTVLVLTAPVLRPHFQRLVDRLVYGSTYNPDEILHMFASQIPSALDRKALALLLADRMAPRLLIRQSALYLLVPEGANLVYAQGVSRHETPEAARQVQTFLASAGRYLPDPAQAGSRRGYVSEQEFDWVRLAIPLEVRKRMIGVWLFGRRDPDDYYSQQDIVLLTTLASQVAVAMENAQLYESIQQELEERRRAVEALQQSEARYRAIVEDQTELIGRFLPGGTIIFVNDAYCRHFSKRREELIGHGFMTVILGQDRGKVEGNLASLSQENPVAMIEARAVMPGGEICWLVWTLRAIFDEQDCLIEFQGVGRDITEHKRAEEKLYEAEARYRTLVEQIPAITYVAALDEASTTLYVSPQVEAILGFSPDDYRVNPDIWRERLHPDDRERVLAEVARSHATREPLVSDYRMLTRDGHVVWLHNEAVLVCDADGHPLFLQGVMLDVTDRKRVEGALRESEERFKNAFEHAPIGIALVDLEGCALQVNRALCEIVGYSEQELLGTPFQTITHPEDLDINLNYGEQLIKGEIESYQIEKRYFHKLGHIVWVSLSASLVRDAHSQPLYVVSQVQDITKRKWAEESLGRRSEEMTALYRTSLEINAQSDIPTLLQAIVQRAAGLIGTQMGGLYLMKPDGETLELVVSHNLPGDYLGVKLHLGEGLAGRVAQTGKPMATEDYLHWEERAAAYANAPLRRVLGVPLKVGDRVIGVIDVTDDKTVGPFGEDEVRLVSLFADQAAIAIENARLYQAEREQRVLAETMREISAALASTLDMDAVLDHLLANIGRVVWNEAADIMLVKEDRARFVRWRGYERFGIGDLTNVTILIADRPDLRQMIETCEPVFVFDTHADPSWSHPPNMAWLRSYAGAPICVRGETIGFLDVTSSEPGAFGQLHAERLRAFADQAAIALENARLFEQAQGTAGRLQAMSYRLVEAQETERRHIAQELHDEIGQIVTGLKLRLEMSSRLPDGALRDSLDEAESLVQELLERVRELSLDLRPAMLDDLGLLPALLWLFERFTAQTKVEVAFKHSGVERRRFSSEVETAAYRIVQEALTNVARHASADVVTVRLWAALDTLGIQVEDNGTGFSPERVLTAGASTGLSSMRERALLLGGDLEIESSTGRGTRLTAELPLDDLAKEL